MSASLAIHHEVQPDDVGLSTDYPRLSATVEGEGNAAILKSAAGVSPDHRERAETRLSGWNVNPRASAQFVSIRQSHRSAARYVPIHFNAPFTNPARCHHLPIGSNRPNTGGGNLARIKSTHAGHFLFTQLSQQFEADFTNSPKFAVVLPAANRASAALDMPSHSKPRSFPFSKINHVVHAVLPSDCRVSAHRSALAELSSVRADR